MGTLNKKQGGYFQIYQVCFLVIFRGCYIYYDKRRPVFPLPLRELVKQLLSKCSQKNKRQTMRIILIIKVTTAGAMAGSPDHAFDAYLLCKNSMQMSTR